MLGALVPSASLSAMVAQTHSEAYMSEYQQLVQESQKIQVGRGGQEEEM